ncbi:aspartic proteinase 39-like isoform X2 [Primulina huaijiensis]|uniref:aspartic proteinase 39-like isoform X2 n=1 Tax=Primulina huaijiensis TaxID=1492673 RepID=UPI003CC788B6
MAAEALLTFVFTSAILSSFLVPISSMVDSEANCISRNTTTMFLPLFLHSNPHKVDAYPRRQLQNSSHRANARMFLREGLLVDGYYTSSLWIGTPPQKFALIVDTGSTLTYVPCTTCRQCGTHQVIYFFPIPVKYCRLRFNISLIYCVSFSSFDPKFQPNLSSTYKPVKCNIDCPCDSDRNQCTYERQYAEISSSSGVLGDDIVSFGNQSELEPQRAVFGCENMETGDLYSQHADGIMGLGRGDLSIVDKLVKKGVISDSFSLCYGGMDVGGGAMVLGGMSSPAAMIFTRSDPLRSPYYNIELMEIHVAGKALPLNPKTFDGEYGTVLDSGTTYAYLPELAFVAFKTAIFRELKSLERIQGPNPNYDDICFSGAESDTSLLSKSFPSVEMVFSNGQKLLLSPENYLFRHSKMPGSYCLGIFTNGEDLTTLLGGIIFRNTLVTYDREHERIGFWKTNCSELWEKLNVSAVSPPLPSGIDQNKSTTVTAPTLASSGPPSFKTPASFSSSSISTALLDWSSMIYTVFLFFWMIPFNVLFQ